MGLNDFTRRDLPPIYVSDPGWDDMGAILDRLDIEYLPVRGVDLREVGHGIVLLNCSGTWEEEVDYRSVESFVERGGTLMASDLTAPVISSFTGAEFREGDWHMVGLDSEDTNSYENVDAFEPFAQGPLIEAEIIDAELAELLGQQRIELDFETVVYEAKTLPEGATPLLQAIQQESVIAYKFPYGNGTGVFTTFHNHSQPTDVEDALLQVLLMVPIAESTGTTVTEAYSTIVGEPDTSDMTLIDPDSGETTDIYHETVTGDAGTRVLNHEDTIEVQLKLESDLGNPVVRTLSKGQTTQLGRDDFQGLVKGDALSYISGTHFELRCPEGWGKPALEIRDLDSTNGTTIDRRDITDGRFYPLESGSTIDLADGSATLTVAYS